jgi:uncharacterized membrane protein YfcA
LASTIQIAPIDRAASPLALWHLLSLDAPTVAVLWTWFIAWASHIRLPLAPLAAMAFAVWALYAADRLLDARPLGGLHGKTQELEARHFFHHRHARAFLTGIWLAVAALAALLPSLHPAAIRLYLVEGVLLCAWFLMLHSSPPTHPLPSHYPTKEIAVGLFFSAAVFIPTIAREPGLRSALLPCALLFAAPCSLNCLFICAWEHQGTRFDSPRLRMLAIAAALVGAVLAVFVPNAPRPIAFACALSAVLLLALNRHRHRLSRIHLRAAADLALLTPLLLLPFMRSQ